MPMTLRDVAEKIGAVLVRGPEERLIAGLASLNEAAPDQLAAFTDSKYSGELSRTRAGAVLLKDAAQAGIPASAGVLAAPDPEMAWVLALRLFHPEIPETPGVDPRAVVEAGVTLGEGVHAGPYAVIRTGTFVGARSVILPHAVVGRNCVLGEACCIHPHVQVYDGVKLGHRVILHSGSVVGADGFGYKFRNGRHEKVPQIGTVEIGDDVEIGANTCIDRAALGVTRIGTGSKIDNLVQIGHNVSIGKHCILCGQAAVAGSCNLGDYVVLGGNAGVADHITMGTGSKAGAKSGIGKDVPPGAEVWGPFAEERKLAFKHLAASRRIPELIERMRELEKEVEKLRTNPR